MIKRSANNCTSENEKNARRQILDTLPNWNLGITPNGKLAVLPCFVHNSVPEIVMQTDDIKETFFSTKSEWAANLVQSNLSIPGDEESLKSLSVCKSTFQKSEPTAMTSNTETIHMIEHNVKAYIVVNDIARLTKEFIGELRKAEEHWPHSPQKSWDKMCLIWDKYGFLWPQRVYIGFKMYGQHNVTKDDDIEDIKKKLLLQVKSQGILHSPKNYSVIWRTKLKPVHEYFPNKYSQKKEFIQSIIQRFSFLVQNDCLFRLINVRSGDYLGRFDFSTASKSERHLNEDGSVLSITSDKNTNTTTSNFCWKFNESTSTTMAQQEHSTIYIFKGEHKFLYSGQQPVNKEVTVLSKVQNNSVTNSNQANIKLVQYIPFNTQISIKDDRENDLKWSIGTSNPNQNFSDDDIFYIEKAIDKHECLKHGDEITLHQQSFYLRTASNYSTYFLSRPGSTRTPLEQQAVNTKSPLSVKSNGDRYNFSPIISPESNNTQPTSGANSAISSFSSIKNKDRIQSPPINASFVFLEKLSSSIAQRHENISQSLFENYRWRIELISKSLIDEEQKKVATAIKSLSIKSSRSGNKDIVPTSIMTYNPQLNIDISRIISPTDSRTTTPTVNNNILVSSMVFTEDNNITHTLQKQALQPTPQQPSKWLDVNPQLYDLQKQAVGKEENTDDRRSISSCQYKTPTGSPPSVTSLVSPTSSFKPEFSEKKRGKQPLRTPKFILTANKTKYYNSSHHSESDDSWSSSEPPSSPIDKNNNIDLNIVASAPVSGLSEAEVFKRNIQQSYNSKEMMIKEPTVGRAQAAILSSILASSPTSNSTSQIRYYDEDEDEFFGHGGSSQVRINTVTPRSKLSQFTPASYANLSPEEYVNYRRCRENSFMLLLDHETKQQFWLNTIKQSSLRQLLNVFTPTVKKFKKPKQKDIVNHSSIRIINGSNSSVNLHQPNNGHRIIQKKKGFYNKKNRKAEGIVI